MQLCHLLPALLLLLLLLLLHAADNAGGSDNKGSSSGNSGTDKLLSRTKRNRFVKKFLEKSKASQDKVQELESKEDTHEWPIIAWKEGRDVFNIGDDGLMESNIMSALGEDDEEGGNDNHNDDFSLRPESNYKGILKRIRSKIGMYNSIFLIGCCAFFCFNVLMLSIRLWIVGVGHLALKAGLKIVFLGIDGPLRQEFVYSTVFSIEEDLLEHPADMAEQGFAACINDVVVAVESYTRNRA